MRLRLLAALAAATALLVAAGGALAPPPISSADAARGWIDAVGPVVAAASLARVVALVAAGWCWLVVGVEVVARAAGAARVAASVERALPRILRRAGIASALALGGAGPAAAGPPPGGTATMQVLDDEEPRTTPTTVPMPPTSTPPATPTTSTPTTAAPTSTTVAPTTGPPTTGPPTTPMPATAVATTGTTAAPAAGATAVPGAEDGVAVMVVLDPPSPAPPAPPPASPTPPSEVATPAPARAWTVRPGESFWSIAGDVLLDRLGRRPSDAEHAAFWEQLIEANRDALVTPDPDLVYPGQVFTVPP